MQRSLHNELIISINGFVTSDKAREIRHYFLSPVYLSLNLSYLRSSLLGLSQLALISTEVAQVIESIVNILVFIAIGTLTVESCCIHRFA